MDMKRLQVLVEQVGQFRKLQTRWVDQFIDRYERPAKVQLDFRGMPSGEQMASVFVESVHATYYELVEHGEALLVPLRELEHELLRSLVTGRPIGTVADLVATREQIWRVEAGLREAEEQYSRLFTQFIWFVSSALGKPYPM